MERLILEKLIIAKLKIEGLIMEKPIIDWLIMEGLIMERILEVLTTVSHNIPENLIKPKA